MTTSEEKMLEAAQAVVDAWNGGEVSWMMKCFEVIENLEAALKFVNTNSESEAGAGDCVCGEPESPNTVHRSDGPCYQSSQECEAGTVAAYVMKAQLETMKRCGSVYVHLRSCLGQQVRPNSEYTALFEAPPSAQAIETAAIMKCVEVCDRHAHSTWNDDRRAQAKLLRDELRALIPQDGRTQLEEFGMKVAEAIEEAVSKAQIHDLDVNLEAIVANLIGAAK